MVKLFLILLLVLLDQLTKLLAYEKSYGIINFVANTGAIWGSFTGMSVLFIWISLIAIGLLIYYYDKMPKNSGIYYVLIMSGILGNLIDRIFRGFVVDFIDLKFWPVFNLADSFIVIGVLGMIYLSWKAESKA